MTDLANFEEIRLNIRDEALSLCKRNDHAKVEQIHLLYAVGKVLGDTGSLNFLSLEVVEERLKLIPRANLLPRLQTRFGSLCLLRIPKTLLKMNKS